MHFGRVLECWDNGNEIIGYPLESNGQSSFVDKFTFQGNSVNVSRDLKVSPISKEEYFHAEIIECARNGFWLEHVPCRPCPYPIEDKNLAIAMNNVSENKYWAISVCGEYSFISNKNTGWRLVCCQLNDSKTIDERINIKYANDYVKDRTPVVYNAATRKLI